MNEGTLPTKFVRYSIHVDTITAAWAFVMERMDEFARPTIQVEACTTNSGEDGAWVGGVRRNRLRRRERGSRPWLNA